MNIQNNISDLPQLSMYRYENFFNIYDDEETSVRYYNLLRNINIFPAENSQLEGEYSIDYNDTWVSISYNIYATMELWWLTMYLPTCKKEWIAFQLPKLELVKSLGQ